MPVNSSPNVHVEFPEFAPSAIPVLDAPIIGTFERVFRGPENEYGTPFIVEFKAVSGSAKGWVDGPVNPLEPGMTYGLWLIHQTLLNHFKEARPASGEKFAVKYIGEQVKKEAIKAGRDGTDNKDRYHGYAFVMPDRPVTEDNLTWDDV